MNSTIGSSIASGVSHETSRHFNITKDALLVLPVSIYLVGYVVGPLVFSVSCLLAVGRKCALTSNSPYLRRTGESPSWYAKGTVYAWQSTH